ncbi:MAG: hypothetical protein HY347_08950, partial [candidate division NC10 bacterium]|nr:hypothetical protein [candidate division NC10 bacterium]
DAKNFAGIRELMRFMATRPELPTRMVFSDTIAVENDRLFDVPFILDGDRMDSQVNDVIPQSGIVPAIADFLLAVVKDNLAGNCPIYSNIVNWGMAHIGGAPTDIERFGAFGVSSIRYPSYEVLGSFAYRFAYEIYEMILEPRGEAVGKGILLATKTLNDCPLTTMVENPATARTAPGEYRQLASKVSTGRTGSLPFPVRGRLTEEVKYGSSWIFWGVSDTEVIQNAETMGNLYLGKETDLSSNTVRGWMNLQARKIIDLFFGTEKFEREKDLGLVEQEIFRLFIKRERELLLPITLSESPHAIVIARDYLKALKDRFDAFAGFWDSSYKRHLYPEGEEKPSLIARQIEAVDKKRGAMQGDEEELQEAYLLEAQRLLDLEVWNILMKGISDLIEVMRQKINRLWALIGDDADGWVNILGQYRDLMGRKYSDDITRRTQFTALKLRKYLPIPGGPAEDRLFEEVADPILNELLRQMHWSFAVDPKDPERYKLVLVSPEVPGYQYQAYEGILLNVFTRERLQKINTYNPYQHVQYARNTLKGPLELKTIWDIMWYEYEHEWRKRPENAERGLDQYVEEQLDWLLNRSEVLLNYTFAPNLHEESYLFSKFLTSVQTLNPSHDLASRFTFKVDQGNIQRTSDDLYAKEIRRVTVALKIPLTNWASYQEALEHYRKYHEVPTNTLVHIYPNEQNAFKVEGLIAQKVDRTFRRTILDPSVAALLGDLALFETFALCLVDGQIPIKKAQLGAPSRYALTLPGGEADLGEVWDADTVVSKVWRDQEVQAKLTELWRQKENEVHIQGKVEELLTELEAKVNAFAFPSPPPGEKVKINLDHLKLALRAVIGAYIEQVRRYR